MHDARGSEEAHLVKLHVGERTPHPRSPSCSASFEELSTVAFNEPTARVRSWWSQSRVARSLFETATAVGLSCSSGRPGLGSASSLFSGEAP